MPVRTAESFRGGVLWNVGSLAVLGLCGVLVNVVIARWGGPGDLGVFNLAYAVYIFASQLAVGGVQYSVLRYVSWTPDDEGECARIASSALALALGLSLTVAAVVVLTRGLFGLVLDSAGVPTALLAVGPGLVFFSLNKVLLGVLNGVRRMRAYAVFQGLRFVLILAGVVLILRLPVSHDWLAGAFTLAEVVLFVVLLAYTAARVVPLRPGLVSAHWCRQHTSFGLRSFLSGALSEVNTRVDVLMLGVFVSDALVGVYSFAAIFAEGVNQLPVVVRNNVDPLLGNRFADGQLERIREYSVRIRRVFWPAMAGLALVASAVYWWGLRLVVPDGEFDASRGVFAVLMLGVALSSGYRPFLGILAQGGRPGTYTLLVGLVVLGNLLGNLVLIPLFGILGAAAATAAMLVLEAVLIVVFARRLFGVRL